MFVHAFGSNFRLVDIYDVMMLFFVSDKFTVTGVSDKFHSFGDKCFVFITITIQMCLSDLHHETIEGSIRYIFNDSVDTSDDKSVCSIYHFNNGVESLIFLPK